MRVKTKENRKRRKKGSMLDVVMFTGVQVIALTSTAVMGGEATNERSTRKEAASTLVRGVHIDTTLKVMISERNHPSLKRRKIRRKRREKTRVGVKRITGSVHFLRKEMTITIKSEVDVVQNIQT